MTVLEYLVDIEFSVEGRTVDADSWRGYDVAESRYIYLSTKKEAFGVNKFYTVMEFFERWYTDCQYAETERIQRVKRLSEIQLELNEDEVKLDNLTCTRYPLLTVRGTCHNQECRMPVMPVNGLILIPCCFHKRIDYFHLSMMENPEFLELLLDALNWLILCPQIDVVYILHDSPANVKEVNLSFNMALHITENLIRVVTNSEEVKRLYLEYERS